MEFEPENSICQECWGRWVKAICKGEEGSDRCEKYREGCIECRKALPTLST